MGWTADYTQPLSFQKLELALVPLSAHGTFYEGDCYVILSVSTVCLFPCASLPSAGSWVPPRSAAGANQVPGIGLGPSSVLHRTGLQCDYQRTLLGDGALSRILSG